MQIVKNIFSRGAFASRGSPFHGASPVRDSYKFQSSLRLQWPARPSLTAELPVDFHVVSLLSGSAATEKTSNILPLFCRGPVKSTGENNESSPWSPLDFEGRQTRRWHTIIHHRPSGWYLIVVFFRFRDLSACDACRSVLFSPVPVELLRAFPRDVVARNIENNFFPALRGSRSPLKMSTLIAIKFTAFERVRFSPSKSDSVRNTCNGWPM